MSQCSKSIKKYADILKTYLRDNLAHSAVGYLRIGLESFRKSQHVTGFIVQPAIGNLSIAIELMLKASIAWGNPALLFKDIPIGVRVLFTAPNQIQKGTNTNALSNVT